VIDLQMNVLKAISASKKAFLVQDLKWKNLWVRKLKFAL